MKLLTALFLLVVTSLFGAVPSYTVFRGTGGILVMSNPPTGNITIDGSGIFTTSGTNATVAVSTNGVLVMAAATNVNFITGTNMLLTATNIGSTAHVGIHGVINPGDIGDALNVFLLTDILPVLVVDNATITNLGSSPPISSVQYNSNGITRGSARFVFTNGPGPKVGIGTGIPAAGATLDVTGHIYAADAIVTNIVVAGQGVEVTTGSFVLNGGTTALVAWNGLGRIRWDADGVMRLENDAANNFNRVNFRDNTAASPALGVTNGDFIVLGGNGVFKLGGSTNKLIAPAVHIANDGVGTTLLRLENPLNDIKWDVAINSHPETYFLGLGRVNDATYAMVWEIGGNVGIGITNPTTRLDVQGRTMLRSNVYFPNISSNALPVALLATDSQGEVYETAVPTGTSQSSSSNQPVLVVVDGDSQSTTNYSGYGKAWANYLAAKQPWTNFAITNIGENLRTASNNVVNFASRGGAMGVLTNLTYHSAVYMGLFGYVDLIFGYPTNDIIASLSNGFRLARNAGYSVVAATIPQGSSAYPTNTPRLAITTNRWAVNNWLRTHARTNQLYDQLVDLETAFTNGGPQYSVSLGDYYWDAFSTNYDAMGPTAGEWIHFNDLGQSIVTDNIVSNVTRWATQPLGVHGGTIRGGNLSLQIGTPEPGKVWTATSTEGAGIWSNVTVAASAETNAVLTNLIGTVARNVTNFVSLSTSNATSKPLTNSYAAGVATIFGIEAGANITTTPNGSNIVIATTGGALTFTGNSNAIPYVNAQGNALTYYDPGHSQTNPGFGFNPTQNGGTNGSQGGFGGLMVFANESQGLVTIGHPGVTSGFSTLATALCISNRYASAGGAGSDGEFKNDMVKIDAVLMNGTNALRWDSTMTRWRVWQFDTANQFNTSSNDVAEITVKGQMNLANGTKYWSNSVVAFPTAADLGVGGYWVGVSNGPPATLVAKYSLDGTTVQTKVLAP